MASNYPDEGLPANEDGDFRADLPSRRGGAGPPAHTEAHTEARAELRDRETYYTELRFAVHCQSRSIPAPRAALDNEGSGAWTHGASAKSAQENINAPEKGDTENGDTENGDTENGDTENGDTENGDTEGESWDDMIARFGDTWT